MPLCVGPAVECWEQHRFVVQSHCNFQDPLLAVMTKKTLDMRTQKCFAVKPGLNGE